MNQIGPLLKNRVDVRRHIAAGVPRVVCNAGHVNQVFMNILTNAAQAVKGEGEVFIKVGGVPGKDLVEVSVRDTGPGIKTEIVEKIFDPFFTTKDVDRGTGLGLAISHGIVERHGGRIEVESRPGAGSTFTIVLPRDRDDGA